MHDVVHIVPGQSCADCSAQVLGGKAFQLALAAADNLAVLRSVVLTANVSPDRSWLDRFASLSPEKCGAAAQDYLQNRGIQIESALDALDCDRFAVRSSATVEDLAIASFAGSFESQINVPRRRVSGAIFAVWKSMNSERVVQYSRHHNLEHLMPSLRMAVLIQPAVKALLSGVALSHQLGNPQSPYLSVDVVRGLGEKLVSGEVEPQHYLMERLSWTVVEARDALDAPLLYEFSSDLGRVMSFLEIKRRCPQDIEFSIDTKYRFWLLQNRPIVGPRN